jgi:hypothetical protein
MPVAWPKQGTVPVAELVSQIASSAHPLLAGRRRLRANSALDRTVALRADSISPGGSAGGHRVAASTQAQTPHA